MFHFPWPTEAQAGHRFVDVSLPQHLQPQNSNISSCDIIVILSLPLLCIKGNFGSSKVRRFVLVINFLLGLGVSLS